jgi:hypothetical protein
MIATLTCCDVDWLSHRRAGGQRKPSRPPGQREALLRAGLQWFGVRTASLAEDGRTWGPPDLVNWPRNVHSRQLPWRNFSV